MLTDVDLPTPGLLWSRWAALAASLSGVGHTGVWSVDDGGGRRRAGASWARLALLDGARAVLFGGDPEHSATATAEPPVDLLTGAPDWLPWTELTGHADAGRLGFVIWREHGRWSRTRYPVADGLVPAVGAVLSGENAVTELTGIAVSGRPGPRTAAERDDLRDAGEQLLAAAVRGEVTAADLARLLDRGGGPPFDAEAALAVAVRGGITTGTRPPLIPAGKRPPMRRVRRLSEGEHDRLVWAAMHDAGELRRPAPPSTGELDALAGWLRQRAPAGDGVCTLLAYADVAGVTTRGGAHPPVDRAGETRAVAGQQLTALVRALRGAESDPRYGRWLFLRVATTAAGVEVERCYDSWPAWWDDDGVSGPWRTHLRQEMDARSRAWRPSWAALLDPEVAYRPET